MLCRYESRLATERDNCVRLQGENGLLRQKFQSALADVTQLQDQIKALEATKSTLQNVSLLPASTKCSQTAIFLVLKALLSRTRTEGILIP